MFLLINQIQNQQTVTKKCKRELLESYNLSSYQNNRKLNLYLCPAITASCCSVYDQFMMFTHWRDVIKKKLTNYYKALTDKLTHTKELLEEILKLNLKQYIENLRITPMIKRRIEQKYEYLKSRRVPMMLDKVISLQLANGKFMLNWRSSFYCVICDFTNHRYIDLKKKAFKMSEASCEELAENTINFSFMMNNVLVKFLTEIAKILRYFMTGDEAIPRVREYNMVRKAVRKCGGAFRSGNGNGKACKQYCQFYHFNANSPVVEGYQVFLNDCMNFFALFLKTLGHPQNERKLASLLYRTEKISKRVLSAMHLPITKDDLHRIRDPYENIDAHPVYNDYVLNEMFNFQNGYEKDREQGYVNFIKNKLHYFDVSLDYEQGGKRQVFKTSSNKVIDLENFATEISVIGGVDVLKHYETTNINNEMKDLVAHLKLKTKYKIYYEKLDPPLLDQLNDMNNEDIKAYHRDNFLYFKDMSLELKRDEIINSIMAEKTQADKEAKEAEAAQEAKPKPEAKQEEAKPAEGGEQEGGEGEQTGGEGEQTGGEGEQTGGEGE